MNRFSNKASSRDEQEVAGCADAMDMILQELRDRYSHGKSHQAYPSIRVQPFVKQKRRLWVEETTEWPTATLKEACRAASAAV